MTTTPKQTAVTKQRDFCNVTSDGANLFSVRGGIPLSDAFNQLTVYLSSAQSVIETVAVSADEKAGANWAASQLLDVSYALVQAMHDGLIEHEKGGAA